MTAVVPCTVVVGAAILDGRGRVLAAQRARPAELAGFWEFPGGKLEPGETEPAALVRECEEELGVRVVPGRFLAQTPIPGRCRLRLWTATLGAGTPVAREHRQLRWVAAGSLDALAWLAADRPLLPPLKRLLME